MVHAGRRADVLLEAPADRLLDVLARPSPGASVPMMSTGGVSSGNVSTLMRGVTTPAKTTSPTQSIRTAIGLRSDSAGHGCSAALRRCAAGADWRARRERGFLRGDAVAVGEQRAPLGDDARARRERGLEEQVAPLLALRRANVVLAATPSSTTNSVAFGRGSTPPRAGPRSPASARRPRCAPRRSCSTGISRCGSARSISKCTVRVSGSALGARRAIAPRGPCPSRGRGSRPACSAATTSKSFSGTSTVMRTVLRSTTETMARARADEGARVDRARGDLAVERRAQDAVAHLEAASPRASPSGTRAAPPPRRSGPASARPRSATRSRRRAGS